MSRSIFIESPKGSAGQRQFAEVEDGQRALRVWNVNGGGGGGGGTEFARDSAAGAADLGTQILAVRSDAGGTLVGADGDYTPLSVDATGQLRVAAAITFPASLDVTQATHDDLNANANVQQGNTDVAAGNALFVQPGTGAVFPVSDNGGSLTVDGTVAATQSGAWTVAATQSGAWNVTIQEPLTIDGTVSVDNFPATQTVDGTVNVGNFPASQTVDDGGLSLTVDGTVAVSNFPASQTVDDGGSSLTIDGTVAVSNFPAVQPVSDNGGSLTVDGTVAATQSGTWNVTVPGQVSVDLADLSYGPLEVTLDGQNANIVVSGQYQQDSIAPAANRVFPAGAIRDDILTTLTSADGDWENLRVNNQGALWVAGTVAVTDGSKHILIDDITEDPLWISTDGRTNLAASTGVIGQAVVYEEGAPFFTDGEICHFRADAQGNVRVRADGAAITINGIIPATGQFQLGKQVGGLIHTNPTGVLAVASRRDTPVASTGVTNGDYESLTVDALGRLWVNTGMPTIDHLSGSTNGQPIQVTGTGSGGAVTIHNPGAGNTDVVYLWATNTSAATVILTVEWGGTGVGNEQDFTIAPNETLPIVAGAAIEGANAIEAYADTANVVNLFGRIERQQ